MLGCYWTNLEIPAKIKDLESPHLQDNLSHKVKELGTSQDILLWGPQTEVLRKLLMSGHCIVSVTMGIVPSSKRKLESSSSDRAHWVSLRMEEISRHIGSLKVCEAKRYTTSLRNSDTLVCQT